MTYSKAAKIKAQKRGRGQLSHYSRAVTLKICNRIAGGESLVGILKFAGMPSRSMVMRWLHKHDEFRDLYAIARQAQAEMYANEIISIADEDPVMVMDIKSVGGRDVEVLRVDSAAVQHQRNRVDARKWVASKLLPGKYGDRLEHVGKDGGPVQVSAKIEFV